MTLMHAVYSLRERLGVTLMVAHLNHELRGSESERDACFVEAKALALGLPVIVQKRSVKEYQMKEKLSLEEAARRVRYLFLAEVARKENCQKIALAHSANDQAETILMKLLRGAGLKGLSGISPVRGPFIRPLIEVERAEIEKFLLHEGIDSCLDSTNLDTTYLRNRVRLELIPLLVGRFNPQVVKHLNQLGEIIRVEDCYLDTLVKEKLSEISILKEGSVTISLNDFNAMDSGLKGRLLRQALQLLDRQGKEISFAHIQQIRDLVDFSGTGKVTILPSGIIIQKRPDELSMTKSITEDSGEVPCQDRRRVRVPGETVCPDLKWHISCRIEDVSEAVRVDFSKDPNQAYFDYLRIGEPLELRTMRPGDRFQPLGMQGTKKLHDYFIDEKISREERRKIPLLLDQQGIIWVVGQRISDRCKVTEKTRKVLIVKAN